MSVSTPIADRLLLNSRQAAELLQISPRKLFSLKKGGKIPVVRFGRSVRFARADLLQAIENHRTAAADNSN